MRWLKNLLPQESDSGSVAKARCEATPMRRGDEPGYAPNAGMTSRPNNRIMAEMSSKLPSEA